MDIIHRPSWTRLIRIGNTEGDLETYAANLWASFTYKYKIEQESQMWFLQERSWSSPGILLPVVNGWTQISDVYTAEMNTVDYHLFIKVNPFPLSSSAGSCLQDNICPALNRMLPPTLFSPLCANIWILCLRLPPMPPFRCCVFLQ